MPTGGETECQESAALPYRRQKSCLRRLLPSPKPITDITLMTAILPSGIPAGSIFNGYPRRRIMLQAVGDNDIRNLITDYVRIIQILHSSRIAYPQEAAVGLDQFIPDGVQRDGEIYAAIRDIVVVIRHSHVADNKPLFSSTVLLWTETNSSSRPRRLLCRCL